MPASSTNTGAQKWRNPTGREQPSGDVGVRRRVDAGAGEEIVPDVIDGHHDDGKAPEHVDGGESVGATVSQGCLVY